ncbi:prephenate dehydrogenase [Candidatus Kuenenia sp.]|uniref:prephenate dehydrogenase n=1 Tax=Candidatus Kuenenia sp. TaxID=2499824 RepID=UPI00321F865D
MMQFGNVCIVGPGLIGGSIGLALRKRNLAETVIGIGHRASSLESALKIGAIDVGHLNADNAVKNADIVILATSVGKIVEFAKQVIPFMKNNSVLTDVGSTKSYIVRQITKDMRDDVSFVGAHPIAGSEKRGIDHASPDLFEGCICFITPFNSNKKAVETISHLWSFLGAKVENISPERHDELLAYVSHLPHLAASCLVNAIAEDDLAYGANGLKDTTRVASGDPELWRDIFGQNRENTIKSIDRFVAELTAFKNDLLSGNKDMILKRLKQAKISRDSIFHNNSRAHAKE